MASRNLASISLKGYEEEVLCTELGNLLVWQREPCSSNSLNSGFEMLVDSLAYRPQHTVPLRYTLTAFMQCIHIYAHSRIFMRV